jgi:hypothetical protein
MKITRNEHIDTIYVKGTDAEFKAAFADRISELLQRYPGATHTVELLSHRIAVDRDGAIHWSAITLIVFEVEEGDDEDEE